VALRTWETVVTDTPAARATSLIVTAVLPARRLPQRLRFTSPATAFAPEGLRGRAGDFGLDTRSSLSPGLVVSARPAR
jgi:hypothetical protein